MDLGFTPTGHAFDRGLTTRGRRAGDRYLLWLGGVLLGYALLSRGFAYLGLPPLFVGEIMIVFGAVAVVRSGNPLKLFAQPATWAMTALLAFSVVRMVPFVAEYGLDAPRDFMLIGYAVYAFIVGALVVSQPDRLAALLLQYRRFVLWMVAAVGVCYLLFKTAETSIPYLPWAPNVHIIEAKGGDIMVHLCGMTVFLILGMMRRKPWLMFALAANTAIVVASNRGGMVAYVLGCGIAYVLRPPEARVGRLAYAFVLLVALGILAGPLASINDGGRSISIDQIVLNVKSVFGQGDQHLDGTKKWRLEWWTKIVDYTVYGPYFWEGRGYGINLAVADGFDVVKDLRSPHNGHMNVLARVGVPGLALWALMLALWGVELLRQWLIARKHGRHRWMALFAFLAAYLAAILVNASFDVYLEGPMGGIWFWSVFGLGLAAFYLHKTRPDVLLDSAAPLDDDRADRTDLDAPAVAEPAPAAAVPAWSWDDPEPVPVWRSPDEPRRLEPAFVVGPRRIARRSGRGAEPRGEPLGEWADDRAEPADGAWS